MSRVEGLCLDKFACRVRARRGERAVACYSLLLLSDPEVAAANVAPFRCHIGVSRGGLHRG
jgi:hypothetical protein